MAVVKDARHSKQTVGDGIHTPIAYEYADSTARAAATGFDDNDLGKFARQLDNDSLWMLTAHNPSTVWQLISVGAFTALDTKSGKLIPGAFSGSPKVATVTFSSAFSDNNYSVTVDAETATSVGYSPKVKNKTSAGFDVDLGSGNIANLVEVGWQAIKTGET